MSKKYSSIEKWKHKLYSEKKFQHEQKRKRIRKKTVPTRNQPRQKAKRALQQKLKKNEISNIAVPSNFNILENPNQVLMFFEKLKHKIKTGEPIELDMSQVDSISIGSIMYFLSMMGNLKSKDRHYYIRGNLPKDKTARTLVENSGFFKYAKPHGTAYHYDKNCIAIIDGSCTDPQIAKQTCDFVSEKLTLSDRKATKPLYEVIVELISNTVHHAYKNGEADLKKWYIFCRYLPETSSAEFVLMDTGLGIPTTVRKTKWEEFQQWFGKWGLPNHKDSHLLFSTLDGAYRTQTQLSHRGKGLPKIYDLYNQGHIKNLRIISNYAFYSKADQEDLNHNFDGTLFYWEISGSSIDYEFDQNSH